MEKSVGKNPNRNTLNGIYDHYVANGGIIRALSAASTLSLDYVALSGLRDATTFCLTISA